MPAIVQPEAKGSVLALLNTKPIAISGVVLAAIGLFGPYLFRNASPELHDTLKAFGDILVSFGTAGAFFGLPPSVKSNAPANT
jgi:hypothetical protein